MVFIIDAELVSVMKYDMNIIRQLRVLMKIVKFDEKNEGQIMYNKYKL